MNKKQIKKTLLTGSFTFQNAVTSVIIQLFELPVKSAQFYHSKAVTKIFVSML